MPATCYRCIAENLEVGEPFGVCESCSSLACQKCGNRLSGSAVFRCVLCYPEIDLMPAAGLERNARPPGGGGPTEPSGGGGPGGELVVANTADWESLERRLAEESAEERHFFHQGALEVTLGQTRRYAAEEARREDLNEEANWEVFDDAAENRRRAEALAGAQWLARSVREAEASGTFRADLLADAFGVACWAIQVRPQHGEVASYERLALLADPRLRFAIGMAMPVPQPQ